MASSINGTSTGSGGLISTGDDSGILNIQTNETTAITVDASQQVLVGTATSTNNIRLNEKIAVVTVGNGNFGGISNTSYNGTSAGTAPLFDFQRSRGTTDGSMTAVASGDTIGYLAYRGSDGTGFIDSSLIIGDCDGTVATNQVPGRLVFKTASSAGSMTERMRIDSSGGLILAGSTAQKATGTTWSNPSDQRLKNNIRDYGKGLAELMQVRVREWEYNGKGGTVDGTKGLGVVADEVMTVLPNTVENYEAKLNADDEETTAIKKFDATEITWLLVKTVQEQQALITAQAETINALTARIVALETV